MMKPDESAGPIAGALNSDYRAPWWLPGGHLQTIYARTLAKNYRVAFRRERWETPDQDFIDLDWLGEEAADAKLVVLFHGLEGGSQSHYARALMEKVRDQGWRGVVPHFRGCSGEANRLARSYHSGDSREIDWILRRLKTANPRGQIYVVGVSLGGNMLLKWLGEEGRGGIARSLSARSRCRCRWISRRRRGRSILVSKEFFTRAIFSTCSDRWRWQKSRRTNWRSMPARFAPV